jgi:hypothetical protein
MIHSSNEFEQARIKYANAGLPLLGAALVAQFSRCPLVDN